jgi:dimethylglycine dehydrogenase
MQLLPDDFERLAPYFEVGFRHFPALGRVGIRKAINGPFTFAPDGNPLVGPVRGLRNYWVACAVMAGFSQGGGIGLVLSRWMAHGDPGQDILSMDVARFGAFATPRNTPRSRCRRIIAPLPARLSERGVARRPPGAPFADLRPAAAAGAVMGANFGLEHALWFAPSGVPPDRDADLSALGSLCPSCAPNARRCARRRAVRDHQLRQVRGHRPRRARMARSGVCLPRIPARTTGLAPMLSPAGRIIGDLSIACLAEDRFMIVGSGFAEEFHLRWFWASEPPADVFVRSAASTLCGVSIAGPQSRELLQRWCARICRPAAFKLFQLRQTAVGFAPAILTRAGFTGELGYEIWTTPDYFATLYDELWDAGARSASSISAAVRCRRCGWRRLRLVQQGLSAPTTPRPKPGSTASSTSTRPISPAAPPRSPSAAGPARRFVVMEVAAADADVIGYESIIKDGAAVGYVTSGAYGHCIGKSLAAGYVPAALARDGESFEIDILGEMRTATVRLEPLYDPQGLRLRG